jgi:protein TonB
MSSAEAPPGPRRRSLGEVWPLYAAGGLVAATLVAVFVMLHPRRSGSAADAGEDAPAIVTAERAQLLESPSSKAGVVAEVSEGARLRVRSEAGGWFGVETDAGARGYLPAEAVERESDRDARQGRTKSLLAFAPVFGVVGEDTAISLAPYPLAARGGRLARGTVIAIHSVDHSYFAFADKKWGIAFVDSARVDLIPPDPRKPGVTPEKGKSLKNLTIINLEDEPPPEEELPDDEAPEAGAPSVPAPAVASEAAPGLVEPPAVLTRVEPAYPDLARRAGVEGTVELEVSIDAAGKVANVEVVRGLPLGMSDAAADAVRRWTFRPARAAAGPVASRKTIRVRFVVRAEDAP